MRYNQYQNQIIQGKMCVWLQYVGFQPAKLASEFKVGEHIVYNNGTAYEVTAITEKSAQWLTFTVKTPQGEIYSQNVKKNTYKPCQEVAK